MKAKLLIWEDVELLMMPQRVLYIPQYHTLLLADWHLGKLGHFRQHGVFVPEMQLLEEFERLGALIEKLNIKRVVFLGDLFHSSWNYEWDKFIEYLDHFRQVEFVLTKGNHDLISEDIIRATCLRSCSSFSLDRHIILSHEPIINLPKHILNIVGHVHPGVEFHTAGRQRFRLPAFILERNILTLPAFGRWTGLHIIRKNDRHRCYAILGTDILEL